MDSPEELGRAPDHRSSLFTVYRVEHDMAKAAGQSDPRLEEIFATFGYKPKQQEPTYSLLNEIELRLLGVQDLAGLAGAATGYLARARAIGLETAVEALDARIKDAISAKDALLLRALLANLLRRTHERFVDRRQEREAREGAALRLISTGGVLFFVWVLSLMLAYAYVRTASGGQYALSMHEMLGKFHLIFLAGFGILGAYLSRLIAFQSQIARLTWDDVDRLYASRVIAVRLAFGGIAAITVYYLILGRIIGGDLFPDFYATGVTSATPGAVSSPPNPADHALWVKRGVMDGSGVLYVLPSLDFAKLIFWSLLSGFAERFLPEQLAAAEGKVAK